MAYTVVVPPLAGWQPIAGTDTVKNHALGTIVGGFDPTYGFGEFIYLLGVASTVVGDMVTWDGSTYQTTRAAVTANLGQPVAWAMSANVASQYGWYQIGGTAVANKSAVIFAPKVAFGVNSIAKVGASASGKQVLNARTANAASVVSATATILLEINRPFLQGRVT